MIALTINGQRRELDGPTPLLNLLSAYGVDLRFVAVAYNGEVVDREGFAHIVLDKDDVVEIVRPVGGG